MLLSDMANSNLVWPRMGILGGRSAIPNSERWAAHRWKGKVCCNSSRGLWEALGEECAIVSHTAGFDLRSCDSVP